MVSLKKFKTSDPACLYEITNFIKQNNILKSDVYYGPKFDGISLRIKWEITAIKDDNTNRITEFFHIAEILTRGGLDVTAIFCDHPDIMKTWIFAKGKGVSIYYVCGEMLIKKSIFETKYKGERNQGKYKNPRNFIGKLAKQKNIPKSVINDLSFEPCTDGTNIIQSEKNWWTKLPEDFWHNLEKYFRPLKTNSFVYLCDGLVIAFKTDKRILKDNYPLNMVALKFPAPQAETEVIGIEWSQKKSGKLIPGCVLKPVMLDGVEVSAATAYNYSKMMELGIGIGSIVKIEKSGDIIPIVKFVLKKSSKIQLPDVEYKIEGKHIIAIDLERTKIWKFVLAMNILKIDGIGETIAGQIGSIVDYDIIELFNPIYKDRIFDVLNGGKIFKKFIEFYNIRSLYLDQVINILQFDNVGPKLSVKVAKLIMHTSDDKSNIPYDVLSNVASGDGFRKIKYSIEQLKKLGISILKPIEINDDAITYEMSLEEGASININGKNYTKGQFEVLFKEKFPNSVKTTLTKTTKFLFVNSLLSQTGKANKARKYNVKLVTFNDAITTNICINN
jgi:NAD-dependent DNA ligase